MESLNKVIEIFTLLKAKLNSLPSLPKVPAHKPISAPSMVSQASTKLPGVAPNTNKDPKKMAEQLKAGQTAMKPKVKTMLKTDHNGQWSISEE